MLRLTAALLMWTASTGFALHDLAEQELHEAYAHAWSATEPASRHLLERAQRGWNQYRAAHCALLGEECFALMAQERAAELRQLQGLTETNDRSIVRAHARSRRSEDQR